MTEQGVGFYVWKLR